MRLYRFPMQIWKVRCDPETGWMGIEFRDHEAQQAYFYAFYYPWEEEVEAGLKTEVIEVSEEDLFQSSKVWWTGLEEVWGGRLFFHGYETQDLPLHFGISARNYMGELLWDRKDRAWVGLTNGGILAASRSDLGGEIELLDPEFGEAIDSFPDRKAAAEGTRQREFQDRREAGMTFPKMLEVREDTSEYGSSLKYWELWTLSKYRGKTFGQVEQIKLSKYHEVNGLSLKDEEGFWEQWLEVRVFGRIVHKVPLVLKAERIGLDTFFMIGDSVVFMKEGKELGIILE